MKRLIPILFAFFLLPAALHAQWSAGVGGFGVWESFRSDAGSEVNHALGLRVGAAYFLDVAPALFVGAGVNYHQIYDPDCRGREHGLDIPVTANGIVFQTMDDVLFVYGGPVLDVGLAVNHKRSASLGRYDYATHNRFNVLGQAGVGYLNRDLDVMVRLGYAYSFLNADSSGLARQHRHLLELGLSYLF